MAVQVWIGEKPEHPNERRAIVALANGLERLDGLYLILANFSVGGRAIDLVIIKPTAIFIIELKHCDGKVSGDVNGPWYVESANGIRKRLNPGRKNPYNQVIAYYYALMNFLNERRNDFLSTNKRSSINFRTCKRVVVIAPTIEEGSHIDIDWKVELKGLDELPAFLVTERSSEIDLSEEEMLAIPEMLSCTRWHEINSLIEGILPNWDETPREEQAQQKAPEPVPTTKPAVVDVDTTPAKPSFGTRVRTTVATWPGRAAVAFGALALVLTIVLIFRQPTIPNINQPSQSLISPTGSAAGMQGAGAVSAEPSCIWSGFQLVGRRQSADPEIWENVGAIGAAPDLRPDVVVTLEEVSFCSDQMTLSWRLQNNMAADDAVLPLTNENITIYDNHGNQYFIIDDQSEPKEIRTEPGERQRGTAIIDRVASLNAVTLQIILHEDPFGEATWLVPINEIAVTQP
ncbi:MAG: NERD domain-containing protein [Chloroflexi bacterium AL-N10]|nr:NERD domain-containing protein [Chloroflexi bacterium AL-N10]NOK73202.1 NERD domain-containing protein [Chloroflexi bacterium AL-N5]